MKASVTYTTNRGTLRARIKLHKQPPGIFDLGIKVDTNQFDKAKQICGDPQVQLYMTRAKDFIVSATRPGSTPQSLWAEFIASQTSQRIHSIKDAFDYYIMEAVVAKKTRSNVLIARAKIEQADMLYMDLKELTPAKIIKWVKEIPVSPSTAYLYFTEFRAVINKYITDHSLDIEIDMNRIVKAPKPIKKPNDVKEFMTLDEIRALLKVEFPSKNQNYCRDLFCLMTFTGMAITDLSRFTLDMVKDGNEGKKWLMYDRQKTGNTCELPLIHQAVEIINKYEWPISVSTRLIQHHCKTTLSTHLGAKITPHTARHSWGCIALEFGFSMESVSKMLGHSTMRTTERIYAKVTRDKIEREMREIPVGMKRLMEEPSV